MSKTKKTVLISIVSAVKIVLNSIITLFLGRLVLEYLGSDYNGVNTTINQIISILTILEGDFSTASLTALFKPVKEKDVDQINGILTYSSRSFRKISLFMSLAASALILFYVPTIKTGLDRMTLYCLFAISVASSVVNICVTNKYSLLIKAEQNEYITLTIELFISTLCKLCSIPVLIRTRDVIIYRLFTLLETVLISTAIALYSHHKYRFADYHCEKPVKVNGTKDLFVTKIVSAIYSSSTVLFLSSFSGTIYTSVYNVFNSIIFMVKQAIYVVVNAPVNAFGSLFSERERKEVYDVFVQYEFIIIVISFLILSTAAAVSQPFVLVYTKDITDVNYNNLFLPVVLALIALTELIHIPSGICINLTRNFSVARKIQTVTCVCLIAFNLIGTLIFGFYGILIGTLLTNIILASMEIIFTRRRIFEIDFSFFFRHICSNMVLVVSSVCEYLLFHHMIHDYLSFFAVGTLCFMLNSLVSFAANYLFNKDMVIKTYERFGSSLISKIRKKLSKTSEV